MQNMIGFRNVAIHEYQKLQIEIVVAVIEKHLADFGTFAHEIKVALAAA